MRNHENSPKSLDLDNAYRAMPKNGDTYTVYNPKTAPRGLIEKNLRKVVSSAVQDKDQGVTFYLTAPYYMHGNQGRESLIGQLVINTKNQREELLPFLIPYVKTTGAADTKGI